MTALLTRPITIEWAIRVAWFKRNNKALRSRAPFILSSSSRGDWRAGSRWTKELLASRFIHAPLCCPVIDAVSERSPLWETRFACHRRFLLRRTVMALLCLSHFDANEVIPETIRTELFAKFRTNCRRTDARRAPHCSLCSSYKEISNADFVLISSLYRRIK